MITGPQLLWIMEASCTKLSDAEARKADGLWNGLEQDEKIEYIKKADAINKLQTDQLKCPAST